MTRRKKKSVYETPTGSPEAQAALRDSEAAFDVFMAFMRDARQGDPALDELNPALVRMCDAKRARYRGAPDVTDAELRAAVDAFAAAVKKHCGEPYMGPRPHPFVSFMEKLNGAGAWWTVLGVSETATPEQLRAAYRKLAREHHPDRGGSVAKMVEINAAFGRATGQAR